MKNHQPSVCFPKKTYQTSVQQFFIEHLPTTTFQRKERNFGYKVLLVSNSDAAWHSFKATLIFICQCLLQLSPPLLPLLKLPGSDRIFVLGSVVHVYLIVASSGYTFFFLYIIVRRVHLMASSKSVCPELKTLARVLEWSLENGAGWPCLSKSDFSRRKKNIGTSTKNLQNVPSFVWNVAFSEKVLTYNYF